MSLIKREPFDEMENFWKGFRFPSLSFSHIDDSLAVDVYEKDKNVIAEMNMPGIDPKDIQIEVEDSYLRISGSKKEEKEEKKKHYYSKEIRRGAFERIVQLPCPVQKTKVKAEYEDGVLKISLPKAVQAKTSRVKIQVKSKKGKK
jgi:HSP20 family protein